MGGGGWLGELKAGAGIKQATGPPRRLQNHVSEIKRWNSDISINPYQPKLPTRTPEEALNKEDNRQQQWHAFHTL